MSIPYPYEEHSAALPPSSTINNYYSLPTTEYRKFVDELEDRIKFVNGLAVPDCDRLEILRGALLGLLEINPDDISYPSPIGVNAARELMGLEPIAYWDEKSDDNP